MSAARLPERTPETNTTDTSERGLPPASPSATAASTPGFWHKWSTALVRILPIYVAIHIAFFVTTCLSFLFTIRDFDPASVPIYRLWQTWHHWDTGHYMAIALYGYNHWWSTAFFPLYPLLERALMVFTHNPLTAGLLISNVADLVLLVVLYELVREDFDEDLAWRTALYLSIFPTAFFFAAGYNESLFLCLVLLSFYNMRHGNWWLAGLFGFFASLTRSAGLFLLFPFCYEYLRQRGVFAALRERRLDLSCLRFDIVSGALIPAGIGVFSLYCYFTFHDFLQFSHAQSYWQHQMHLPWYGIIGSMHAIAKSEGFLSFQTLRNLLDLVPDLLVCLLIVLSLVGPYRFPRALWSYCLYAATLYLFLQLFPVEGTGLFPLQSVSRYMLEVFPAFIVLAKLGKSRMFNMNYLMICGAILFFLLTQFLTGHWVL